ncbi:hypothetical protein FJTKL_07038 [Diaporthe vaccinii]|uniref:Uncharacterized protein n=1 Tax=Diaporthe vaccinii TaxID=105482 RepID=A0ABR4EUW3_9PEZI
MLGPDQVILTGSRSNDAAQNKKKGISAQIQSASHRIMHAASRATNAAPKETTFAGAALVMTAVVLADGEPLPPVTVPFPPEEPDPDPDPEPPEPEPEPEPLLPEPPVPEPAPVGFVGVPGRVAVAPPAPPAPVPPTVTTLPAPAEIPGDPPSAPLAVAAAEDTPVAALPPDAVAVPEAAADEEEDDDEAVLPTTPKLGEGVSGEASWSVYHQVLVLPNRVSQPTSSQYVFALAVLASAWFPAGPLTGHPVSVTQTSLPLAAALVWPNASLKRAGPFEMEFAIVVFGEMLVLEGVGIDTEPVRCRNHGIVGRVDPSSPRIDVTDRHPRQRRASNGIPDLLDVADENIGAHARVLLVEDAGGRDAVEIL